MVRARHLVVDSGGFLKNADIRSMGKSVYTVREVVSEIRDKATRQGLSVLPYELTFKRPSQESVNKVTEASKKTGDFPSLSSVDIQVLALTLELTRDHCPERTTNTPNTDSKYQFGADKGSQNKDLPGFFMPEPEKTEKEGKSDSNPSDTDILEDNLAKCNIEIKDAVENTSPIIEVAHENPEDGNDQEEEFDDEEEDSEEEEDGWITPGNIEKFQRDLNADPEEEVEVACVTTDFAMQNVLMKMSLDIISVDGMRIKSIRSYVLRCHSCFNITKIMTKTFCPKCGNNTLKRVPTEVLPDGSVKYYLSRNPKVLNKRGKKFSLPMPRGGKHSRDPILCEDQPVPQNRISKKSLQKTNVWSDDYAIDGAPFAFNETDSRAFRLGIRQGQRGRRRNPNAVGKKFVKRR